MGFQTIQLNLRTDYSDDDIRRIVRRQYGFSDFSFQIEKKSLDARKKNNIHWQLSIIVSSEEIKGSNYAPQPTLNISYKKRKEKVVVVGSGPAGFFAAHVLQLSGFQVTIIERGSEVRKRSEQIDILENTGNSSAHNNYAFGEGGAGTFSDGKLTSRSKHISAERQFILSEYVKAGAPEEILYMAHPHIGTDNLKKIVVNLRKQFIENGGTFLLDTPLQDMVIENNRVKRIIIEGNELEADHFILATGHSAYETYRMLIKNGIGFNTKNFAIGHRIEHPQALINHAQWGTERLPGVKAAEYRLTTKTASNIPVYTFCMCPGGKVVPAAAYEQKSVVNGMSYYMRDGMYSNAGCVAGVHPDMLTGHKCTPSEILDWMDKLEENFYRFSESLVIPANMATDYINHRVSKNIQKTSYPLGTKPSPLFNLIPSFVSTAISEGLVDFSRKIKGFDQGILMGLESKTSSPLQVVREPNGKCTDFNNLYFVGEGSGFAGGIISSAADGVKCAMSLCD